MAAILEVVALFCLMAAFSQIVDANCAAKAASLNCLFTKKLPTKSGYCYLTNCRHGNFMASIGNGFLATVINSDTIHVAGVYNGKTYVKKGHGWPVDYEQHTRRARVPSSAAISFQVQATGDHSYALDIEDGVFYHWFSTGEYEITQRVYAHRVYRNLLVNEFQIKKTSSKNLLIAISNHFGNKSNDIDFSEVFNSSTYRISTSQRVFRGKTKEAETPDSPRVDVAVVYSEIPKFISMPSNITVMTKVYLTAISTSLEGNDTVSLALKHFNKGINEISTLFQSHQQAWNQIWNSGSIVVGGNLPLAQAVSASLYNIISSTRVGWPFGLSPGGLPGGEEYLGHVFWDQDIWMYPVLVALYPMLARESLNYRYNRLDAARGIAKKFGYRGAMFPWESALTGVEVSPGEVYGRNQIHITSDIAYAIRQYWRSTGDLQWMKDKGFEMLYETAKFWASRVNYDPKRDLYVINDVMPPDEHTYPANNSVYTNVGAKLNLEFVIKMAAILGRFVPDKWEDIIDRMYIPFNEKEQYHPEHDSFKKSDIVKQADTILIGYPLMYDVNKVARENDLKLYGKITNPNGPAMTHSMFTIGWLEIGNKKKATEAFVKNFNNIHGPFKVWSEIRFGKGATNFITGAGGFLQSLINGYGGIRLREDGLYFKGSLPDNCTYLTLNGIKFHGNSIMMNLTTDYVDIKLVSKESKAKKIKLYAGSKVYALELRTTERLYNKEGVVRLPTQVSSACLDIASVSLVIIMALYNLQLL